MIVLLGGAGYVGTAFKEALESDEREVLSLRRAQVDYSDVDVLTCLLYTSPSPRDQRGSRMPSSA